MTQEKIDQAAVNYNKTKDPKYKKEWYRLIKRTYGQRNSVNNSSVQRRGKVIVHSI